jgi:HTH-type transcriptional regulator / antitoxin HipB
MHFSIIEIAKELKAARKRQGMSQRLVSKHTGVPQSQVSKIENGTVDLRTSSLIELSRAVQMDVMLVPRKAIPAVESIVKSFTGQTDVPLKTLLASPAYRLDDDEEC